jgi:hypothetical protein
MQAKSLGWHVELLRFPAAATTMDLQVHCVGDVCDRPRISFLFFFQISPNTPIILQKRPVDIKIDRHLGVALIHGIGWASRATFGC